MPIAEMARTTVLLLEALARDELGGTNGLYERDAGESLPASSRAGGRRRRLRRPR